MAREIAEVLTEDNYPPLAVSPLTPQELKVREHWKRFLPKTCAGLGKKLDLEVRKTVHRVEFEIGVTEAKTGLSRAEIEPMFRDQLYPPPETASATPATR